MLRLPRDLLDLRTHRRLALVEGRAEPGSVSIGPRGFHDDPSEMGVAGFRDRAAPRSGPGGVFTRDDSGIAHQLPRTRKPGELPEFSDHRHRRDLRDAAER